MKGFFKPRTIRFQLVVWNAATLAVMLAVLGVASRYVTRSFLIAAAERELERQVRPAPPNGGGPGGPDGPGGGEGFRREPPPGPSRPPPWAINGGGGERRPPPPLDTNPMRPLQFDLDGNLRGNDTRVPWDAAAVARSRKGEKVFSYIERNGEPFLVYTSPSSRGISIWQGARSLRDVNLALAGVDRTLIFLIPVALLAALVAGFLVTRKVLGVVNRTAETVDRMDPKDLSARLPVSGGDEMSHLARTFNSLLDRTESAFRHQARALELQRRFTADASHELKTPLTVIRGSASLALSGAKYDEAAYRSFLDVIQSASVSMTGLVQDLLLLARSDEGTLGRDRAVVPLAEIIEAAIAMAPHGTHPLMTIPRNSEGALVQANRQELTRVITNLIDNAIRYSPSGSPIEIDMADAGPGEVAVRVRDYGVGIAPEHIPLLGRRFYRVDTSRSRASGGTGLGLSICKGIVKAHNGRLTIESELGEGTTVSVILPRNNSSLS